MDTATYEWVVRLVEEALESGQLTEWETGFFTDQQVRLKKTGISTPYTPKQLAILDRVAEKLDFEEKPTNDYY